MLHNPGCSFCTNDEVHQTLHVNICWKLSEKINTSSTLGYALLHNGGVKNVGVQVVNSNIVETRKVEDKFNAVTKIMKTYFTWVNHAYFYSSINNDTQ